MEKDIILPINKPFVITKWFVKKGSTVRQGTNLCLYHGEGESASKKLRSAQFGTITNVCVNIDAVNKPGITVLKLQGCLHPIVMKDMCAECGEDLREKFGVSGDRKEESSASVAMVHSIPELIVSSTTAKELGRADEKRLLDTRKLVLLVDLDETLLHTTNDNVPPNLQDVYHFQLQHGRSKMWYHTKFRPGTQLFLEKMSKLFELHICTFGTRLYAHTMASYLDPDKKYFSHRILSRDECFDSRSKQANLKALFPCGDGMVSIIDDREEVWKFTPNMIKVKPYHYFEHTADINAPPGMQKTEEDDKTTKKRTVTIHKVPKNKPNTSNDSKCKERLSESKIKYSEEAAKKPKNDTSDSQNGSNKMSPDVEMNSKLTNKQSSNDTQINKSLDACTDNTDNKIHQITDDNKDVASTIDNQQIKGTSLHMEDTVECINELVSDDGMDVSDSDDEQTTMTAADDKSSNDVAQSSDNKTKEGVSEKSSATVINKAEIEVETIKEVKTSSAEVKTSCAEVEISSTEEKTSSAEVKTSSAEGKTSSAEVKTSNAEEKTSSAEVKTSSAEGKTSSAEVKTSSAEGKTSSAEVKTSSAEGKTSSAEVKTSSAEGKTASAEVKTSSAEGKTSSAEVKTSSAEGKTSSAEGKTPSAEVKTLSAKVKTSCAEVEISSAEGKTPSAEVKTSSAVIADDDYEEVIEWEDSDDYLLYLEEILTTVHKIFFDMHDELKARTTSPTTEEEKPNLKKIVPYAKQKVLQGVNIVFSGVVPTNTPLEKSRPFAIAKALGAQIQTEVTLKGDSRTTHVIAALQGTAKVHQASKHKDIAVVKPDWLYHCDWRWERVDERLFLFSNKSTYDPSQEKQGSSLKRKGDSESNDSSSAQKRIKSDTNNSKSGLKRRLSTEDSNDTDTNATRSKLTKRNTDESRDVTGDTSAPGTSNDPDSAADEIADAIVRRRFSDSINPLARLSKDDLDSLSREVDEMSDDSEDDDDGDTTRKRDSVADNDGEELGSDDATLRQQVLGLSSPDTSSDESMNADFPPGWRPKSRSPSYDDHSHLLEIDDPHEAKQALFKAARSSNHFLFEEETNSVTDNSDGDSQESCDDDLAAAVERGLFS